MRTSCFIAHYDCPLASSSWRCVDVLEIFVFGFGKKTCQIFGVGGTMGLIWSYDLERERESTQGGIIARHHESFADVRMFEIVNVVV